MTAKHEKLLIATLAGIIIAGAAAFAIGPALASGITVKSSLQLVQPSPLVLTLRLNETI